MLAQHFKMIRMVSNAYDLKKIQTLYGKCLRFLPPTPPCYLNMTSVGFQSVHFPFKVGHNTQEKSFLAPRDKGH